MLLESTYGDRVSTTWPTAVPSLPMQCGAPSGRGGTVVIPAFAVDRTEVLLFHLRRLLEAGAIPDVPVYVDSPMAIAALVGLPPGARRRSARDSARAAPRDDPFDPRAWSRCATWRHRSGSTSSGTRRSSISASGMATGGRVLHHLQHRLPDPRNTIVLVGYQAEGTRGRQLLDGARQIKLLGHYVPVRAEVVNLPAFSVHAARASWSAG